MGGGTFDPDSPKLKRVLYLADLGPLSKFGSLEEGIFILACAFRDRGGFFLPVFRYALAPDVAAIYRDAGQPVEVLDLGQFRLGSLFRLIWLVQTHRIEVVHWNLYHAINPYVWALSMLAPATQHWMTDHFSRPASVPGSASSPRSNVAALKRTIKRTIKRTLLRRYRRMLCVSRFVRASLEAQGIREGLSCCQHMINTDRFSPDVDAGSKLRISTRTEHQFVLLVVAYLIPQKGVDVVLYALPDLPERVVLWIVGDGEDAAHLHQLTADLSIRHRVRFWGQQQHVEPFMQAADCLVCPSIWEEAAGLVVLESLACGLPVLASKVGGIPEYVEDGRNGFLFPSGSPEQLAERVRRLTEDRESLRAMSQSARHVALERCSISARLAEFLEIYGA
jgi:glycosyltransferase involved in cell wall biosynthesis